MYFTPGDDTLDTTDNIMDTNIRRAAIIDIRKYSGYHSYYKHLLTGSEHIVLPKLYGQVRGYNRETRKVGRFDGMLLVLNILISIICIQNKYDPEIADILKKCSFTFNCC